MTAHVRLRKVTREDQPRLFKWRQDNAKYFIGPPPETLGDQYKWFTEQYEYYPGNHLYMITYNEFPVGTIGISLPSRIIGNVLLGYKEYSKDGVMHLALLDLMGLYGYTAYYLSVLTANEHAIKFYQRNGFRIASQIENITYMELLT